MFRVLRKHSAIVTRSNSAAPFLTLREATFRLGDDLVFAGSCWTFRRNEHWAVVGPNGSGKSLLADALRGLLPLVGGELCYHFQVPAGLAPEQAIGHVSFEDRKAEIHGTVAQSRWNSIEEEGALQVGDFLAYERVMEVNPYEVSAAHHQARRRFEARLRRAVSLLEIGQFWDRTLLSLSNGERQRVELASALCHPLRLLILDDPFVGLDIYARKRLHQVLAKLMRTALRVLLISQRPEDLPRGITHVLQLDACQIVAIRSRARMLRPSRGFGRTSLASPLSTRNQGLAGLVLPKVRANLARPKPLVVLKDVTVQYGEAIILNKVSWTVRKGESWSLLGPNGAGKSTLLSLILGDNPQGYVNDVEVFGQRRGTGESILEMKRRIGCVSPELHLHFNNAASCFEVVASGFYETLGLFEQPAPSRRRAVRRWLKAFKMLEFANTPLFALSLGQQRMALLARALVKRPHLLILDEPCQGLDAAHRRLFLKILDTLLREKTVTAIYVTHRPDEIPRSIQRVLRLVKGRVMQ
ncbi:MAG TPA: ATP-binding cassette domain-containing protein [Candidatus Limnocylindrales bacterium]|nr:ATP-binding cassette domain-containing protein [Candidatus Limnocylindrales bacterium]